MIARAQPGPYEDNIGPYVLGTFFVASIVAQFLLKLFQQL